MKKILFTILTITLISLPKLKAQEIKYGIKGGLNVSDWRGQAAGTITDILNLTNVFETNVKPGFHLGTFLEIPVGDRMTIEPGIYYSQKGIEVEGRLPENLPGIIEVLNVNATITNKAHYIDIPVLAKFYVSEGFNVFAGTQLSYLVDNQLHVKASALGFNVLNRDLDINAGFRKLDVGLVVGAGYKFANGVSLSSSYDFGLTSLDERNNFDVYNQVAKVSVGYTF